MARSALLVLALWIALAIPIEGSAATCLTIENLKGQSASSDEDYKFVEIEFGRTLTFCYDGDYGKVDNNAGVFQRFGSNSWISFDAIHETEMADVWTFDFASRKALFARIRADGILLPSSTNALVGDITGTEIQ